MSYENLSYADRWMRKYETEHPEIIRSIKPQRSSELSPFNMPQSENTAVQKKTRGTACLLTSSPEPSVELDPVVSSAIFARKQLKLTQTSFARCLGISPRTLRDWEQGRRRPSGAALTLLTWAADRPDYLRELHRVHRKRAHVGL